MNRKFETDFDALKALGYDVKVNGEEYVGKIAIGDTVVANGITYAVVGLNEDNVVVKELN